MSDGSLCLAMTLGPGMSHPALKSAEILQTHWADSSAHCTLGPIYSRGRETVVFRLLVLRSRDIHLERYEQSEQRPAYPRITHLMLIFGSEIVPVTNTHTEVLIKEQISVCVR